MANQKTQLKTAVLFASRPVTAGMRRYVPPGALVLAADAGWHGAAALGLAVDVAVGDFDSSTPPPNAGEVLTLPAEKDDTDTHYAAKVALARGYNNFVLLGALGGRPDHHHTNLQVMLYLARHGASVLAADDGVEMHCLPPGRTLAVPRANWRWLSVFAAGGEARGVYERGVKYPLTEAVLTPDSSLGTSNEFAAEQAEISCREGCLYVMLCDDRYDG